MEKGRFPEVVDSFHAQGPVKVQNALASYLAEQVKKGELRKMNPDVGARQDAISGLFGALFGAGVLGWGAGWIGYLTGQSM
jgi:hypothetical protein